MPPAFLPLHLVNESWHDINLKMKHLISVFPLGIFRDTHVRIKLESLWERVPKLNAVMLAVGLEHTWHNVAHQGGWRWRMRGLVYIRPFSGKSNLKWESLE